MDAEEFLRKWPGTFWHTERGKTTGHGGTICYDGVPKGRSASTRDRYEVGPRVLRALRAENEEG